MFDDVLAYVHMYMDVNTAMRYVINLEYDIWVSCHYSCHVVRSHFGLLLSKVIIVNNASSYVINLHGKYVCFSTVLLRYRCGSTLRIVSPKEEGSVIAPVKIQCN